MCDRRPNVTSSTLVYIHLKKFIFGPGPFGAAVLAHAWDEDVKLTVIGIRNVHCTNTEKHVRIKNNLHRKIRISEHYQPSLIDIAQSHVFWVP